MNNPFTIALAAAAALALGLAACKGDAPAPGGGAPTDPAVAARDAVARVIASHAGLAERTQRYGETLRLLEPVASGLAGLTEPLKSLAALRDEEVDLLGLTVKVWDKLKEVPGVDAVDKAIASGDALAGQADALKAKVAEVTQAALAFRADWEAADKGPSAATLGKLAASAAALAEGMRSLDALTQAIAKAAATVRGYLDAAEGALAMADSVPVVGDYAKSAKGDVSGLKERIPGLDMVEAVTKMAGDAAAFDAIAEAARLPAP